MRKPLLLTCLFLVIIHSINAQHPLDVYLNGPIKLTTINTAPDKVYQPKDLDFKPGTYELWILAKRQGGPGMGTVIFYNAGQPGQKSEFRQEGQPLSAFPGRGKRYRFRS
jgi:hypothetical protein